MRLFKKTPVKWRLIGKTQDTNNQTTTLIFENEAKTKHKTLKVEGIEPETLEAVLDWVDRYGNKRLNYGGKQYAIFSLGQERPAPTEIAKLPIKPPPKP